MRCLQRLQHRCAIEQSTCGSTELKRRLPPTRPADDARQHARGGASASTGRSIGHPRVMRSSLRRLKLTFLRCAGAKSRRGGFSLRKTTRPSRGVEGPHIATVCHQGIELLAMSSMDLEHDKACLRGSITRLQTLLRPTGDARVKAGLKDLISDARRRLEAMGVPAT